MNSNWECYTRETQQLVALGPYCPTTSEMMKLMGVWQVLLAIIVQIMSADHDNRARAQILLRQSHSSIKALDLETLSSTVHHLYLSETFPKIDNDGAKQGSNRLLGLHSLYHLCQMILLCPLVSIFSGQPQSDGSPQEDAPAKARVILSHAIEQARLVRGFLARSGDISTISPLTGFSSFVSASTLLNAAKSWMSRIQPEDVSAGNGLYEISNILSETLDLLDTLQIYWTSLRPTVSYA